MSLIKDNTILKANFSSMDKDYSLASLQSFIDTAEQNIVIPWIGQEIYDVIHAAYNPGPVPGGKLPGLLVHLQRAVTHLAFMLAADSGAMRISDSGFYVNVTASAKPVSDKKMEAFYAGRRDAGYQALEQAVEYLERNITDAGLVAYLNSDAHKFHRAYFINTSVTFTRYYKKVNNSAYLFWQLLDALDFAERTYIQPVLGRSYFNALKTAVLANTLSPAQTALLPYINRALANFTIAEGAPNLPVVFEGENLVIKSQLNGGNFDVAGTKTAANTMQLSNLVTKAMATGKSEIDNLLDYLVENAASLPGYTPPPSTADVNINDCNAPTFFV